ncbi:hypothetical protein C8Q80DRAFT_491054 [Daedaleopsis nitida]|nr:hypothetical protein C8Q80DRAFT_491054 [Daedaleopsis nitida]
MWRSDANACTVELNSVSLASRQGARYEMARAGLANERNDLLVKIRSSLYAYNAVEASNVGVDQVHPGRILSTICAATACVIYNALTRASTSVLLEERRSAVAISEGRFPGATEWPTSSAMISCLSNTMSMLACLYVYFTPALVSHHQAQILRRKAIRCPSRTLPPIRVPVTPKRAPNAILRYAQEDRAELSIRPSRGHNC